MKTSVTQNVKGFFSESDITLTWSSEMSWNNVCALRQTLTFIPAQTAFWPPKTILAMTPLHGGISLTDRNGSSGNKQGDSLLSRLHVHSFVSLPVNARESQK